MLIVKGFNKDLTCRGYQFKEGLNVTDAANCARNGFHGAENPLDCLIYYPDMKSSVYWLCQAGGDLDEDHLDSKVTCTELTLLRELTLPRFVCRAMEYVRLHPKRPLNRLICKDRGVADRNHFVIVYGKDPVAAGNAGDYLGYIVKRKNGVLNLYIRLVDGEVYRPGVFYNWFGDEEGNTDDGR